MSLHLKDPEARIAYAVDWGAAYLGSQTIAASAWAVTPAEAGGLVVVSGARDGRTTSALVEGGVAGRLYRLTNRVTLSDGSADERSLAVRVEQR